MKKQNLNLIGSIFAFGLFAALFVFVSGCTHDDQNIEEYIPQNEVDYSTTELLSHRVATAPNIDATIDGVWAEAQELRTKVVVPDPGDNVFRGYEGDAHNVTLRSLYDDQYIYFLAEWDDQNKDLNRDTWYFDPVGKKWHEESNKPTFNANGVMTRPAFYEDKLAMLWNVNNSVADWNNKTCYASCHVGLGQANGFARHYTNAANEYIDMWHWKSVRSEPNGQFDDQFQDSVQPNGRHGDSKTGGGYTDNKQTLTVDGSTETVDVPKYVIPNREYYYWILQSEIDNGTAKLITGVDANGILYYDGGSIDPNVETGYQRDGSTTGPNGVPSIFTAPFEGSRGDLLCKSNYNGSGWILEFKRKLKTADTENQDIDFTDLSEQYFGLGIFDNAAIAHAIKPNLKLVFEK